MRSERAAKGTPKNKIERGSVPVAFRHKKIARQIENAVEFLVRLSESGLADSSRTRILERDLGLADIQLFLLRMTSASGTPEAIREEARTLAGTAGQLAARPPIYEVPPAIRKQARRLAFALGAATRRGTGSSKLTPEDRAKIVSLMQRMIDDGMSQHKAAESLCERLPRLGLTSRRLEQIYKQFREARL